jgi:hypothetical protein
MEGYNKLWVCSNITWNLPSFMVDAKAFVQHYEMQFVFHYNDNEKGGSPLDLKGSHKYNGSS